MANTIETVWTSDTTQLIRDFQKRQALLEKELAQLRQYGPVSQRSTQQAETGFTAIAKAVAKLGTAQADAGREASKKLAAQKAAALEQAKVEKDALAKSLADQQAAAAKREKLLRDAAARSLAAQKAQFAEGQRVTDSVATAQDKYNLKLIKLRELLRAGAIDQKVFNRAVTEANPSLRQAEQQTGKAATGMGQLLGRLAGVATGVMSIGRAWQFTTEANRENQRVTEESLTKQEELVLRFRAQAGLNDLNAGEARKGILGAALRTATTSQDAFGAATALVSTGFDAKEAAGGALTPFLKLLKAQALDPKKAVGSNEMAESFSKFLSATGQAQTGANVEKLAIAIQGLKATPLKVTDLSQLAKQASGVKELGNVGAEEQLANFAFLTQTEDSEEAGTHLREIVRQLATAGSNKKARDQLKKMGLRPEDVDFVGESFQEVLARVQKGVAKLPEKDRATALDTLVEGRNISAFTKLAKGQDEVDKLRKLMADKEGFEADYRMTSTGSNATSVRRQVELEITRAARASNSKNDREAFEVGMERKDTHPLIRKGAMMAYDWLDAVMGHEDHLITFGDQETQKKTLSRMIRGRVERNDNEKIIEESRKDVREQRVIKVQVAPIQVKVNGVNAPPVNAVPQPVKGAALGLQPAGEPNSD